MAMEPATNPPTAGMTNADDPTAFQPPEQAAHARARSEKAATEGDATVAPTPEQERDSKNRSIARPHIAGYRLLRSLGHGTYGEVWLAEEDNTGVPVAIKLLTRDLGQQWQILQAEVRQLAMLQDDAGIVQLKDFDPHAARPYYVMAYAEGGCLARHLKHKGPMAVAEAVPLFRKIAQTLAYVHAKGIRHCDLKPGNILLDKMGRPRVADFGQAHLASDLAPALGTFFYMAPEQADLGAQIPDTRWDVYGLGALLYAMLVGTPPYEESSLKQELARTEQLSHRLERYRDAMSKTRRLTAHRKLPGMDGELASILERCLAVDPAKRFPNAEAVVDALDRRDRSRRHAAILRVGVLGPILLLLTLAGLGWWEADAAVKNSQRDLEQQAVTNYTVSAKLAGARVKGQIVFYLRMLQEAAKQEELGELLTRPRPPGKDAQIQALLKKAYDAIPLKPKNNPVYRFALFDEQGSIAGMEPLEDDQEKYITQNFAWRGYFHGGPDGPRPSPGTLARNQDGQPYRPLGKMQVSPPFMAVKPDGTNLGAMVALSTPVKSKTGEIVGVLVATLTLKTLNGWLEAIQIPDGFPVLVDDRFHLLEHKHSGHWGVSHKDCLLYQEIFAASAKQQVCPRRDPMDNEEYLVGYELLEFKDRDNDVAVDQRWAVLVQVKHDKVIEPAVSLRNEMLRWGAVMLAVALLVILTLWIGLVWLLRREEHRAYG
jgi:hypothetical protein